MLIIPSNIENTAPTTLSISDTRLSWVHVYEYLGVYIDDKLTMSAQIDKVCTTVQKKYGVLRKICRYTGLDTAILIYKVMIRPHFDYRDYMIDCGTQCKIEKIGTNTR